MTVDLSALEQQYSLPSGLLSFVQNREDASGDPNAVSPAGAIGPFQFEPSTAKAYGVTDPTDYDQSAVGAAKMFSDLSNQYNGSVPHMLAAYNWGSGNVDKKGLDAAPKETKNYIEAGLKALGNAIIPSAQAAEVSPQVADPSKMTDEELMTELSRQNLMKPVAQPADNIDLGYKGDIPSITVRPQGQPVLMPSDPSMLTDEQLFSELSKQGLVGSTQSVPTTAKQQAEPQPKASQLPNNPPIDADSELRANAQNAVNTSPLAALGAYGLNVMQAPTFGWGGTIASGLLAALPNQNLGDTYGQRYANLQKFQQAYREAGQNQEGTRIKTPSWMPDITANGLGEVGSTLASLPLLPAPSSLPSGLGGAIWGGAKAGGKYGAVYGAGQGDAFQNDPVANAAIRAKNALIGLGGGALGGALMGAGGYGGSKLADLYRDTYGIADNQGLQGADKTYNVTNDNGATASPNDKIADFENKHPQVVNAPAVNFTPAQQRGHYIVGTAYQTSFPQKKDLVQGVKDWADTLEDARNKTGLDLRAIDVATNDANGIPVTGKDLQGLMLASARMPGGGAQLAGEMASRSQKIPEQIGKVFDDLVSKNKFYDVADKADAEGNLSSPLYKEAFKQNQSMSSPLIDKILETPAGKDALKGAVEQMQDEMRKVGVPDKDLTEQARDAGLVANGGVASGLKMQTLDYVKRELDAMARAAYKRANNGSGTVAEASRYASLAKQLRNEMDRLDITAKAGPNSLKPEGGLYAQARAKSATKLQMQDALEKGRDALNADPEEIQRFMADEDTSDPQKLAYAAGLRRAIADRFRNNPTQVTKLWQDTIRPRIEPFAPNADALNEADAKIDLIKRMQQNNNFANLAGNSITMPAQQSDSQRVIQPEEKVQSSTNICGALTKGCRPSLPPTLSSNHWDIHQPRLEE